MSAHIAMFINLPEIYLQAINISFYNPTLHFSVGLYKFLYRNIFARNEKIPISPAGLNRPQCILSNSANPSDSHGGEHIQETSILAFPSHLPPALP